MSDVFEFCDDLGPAKVLHVSDRQGLRGIVVVDNVAAGPAIGGVRMAADASLPECARLARAMTMKNAAARLPHGGGKAVIVADPHMPVTDKERTLRAFARAIRDLRDYIPGPDMGTDEQCMAWVLDEMGRAVGLPSELGGIPLDEIGATGFGLMVATEAAFAHLGQDLSGARVAVQGFGSVGQHAARFLCERGAVLVAASDSRGCVSDPDGLDVNALIESKNHSGTLGHAGARVLQRDAVIDVECEIWIPAARPDVIRADNVDRLNTRIIAQGANIGITADAERMLHERGVLSLPDFIANAGGVICAAVEHHQGTRSQAFQTIRETIEGNVRSVLENADSAGTLPRDAAMDMAAARVRRAMGYRR